MERNSENFSISNCYWFKKVFEFSQVLNSFRSFSGKICFANLMEVGCVFKRNSHFPCSDLWCSFDGKTRIILQYTIFEIFLQKKPRIVKAITVFIVSNIYRNKLLWIIIISYLNAGKILKFLISKVSMHLTKIHSIKRISCLMPICA